MGEYILTLDQGTTSSRAILFNKSGEIVTKEHKALKQIYPKAGWVEHCAEEIWQGQLAVAKKAIATAGIKLSEIISIGITNQRETVVLWDKHTGRPVHNAIVWQCRRTADICQQMIKDGWETKINEKTGLVIDAYFSGTKVKWILDNFSELRQKAKNGELLFGTIDSWLIWKLTGGRIHATDYSNASRTMMYNIHKLQWDEEILTYLDVPDTMLPEVKASNADYGTTVSELFGLSIPITGVAGDQQAALFGQCCFKPGMIKNTYGTGCFILMNTGQKAVQSERGLLTTIAWGLGDEINYALEGSVFIAGAVIEWLRDGLNIIDESKQSELYASKVKDTEGVYLVPAFVGLGAPYWDMYARGTIVGITRGTNKYHITRAALESIAYQTKDVLIAMLEDAQIDLKGLRVDGGASANNFLMQFQADILQNRIDRPLIYETTALGAAYLAGLGAGVYQNIESIVDLWKPDKSFYPQMERTIAQKKYIGWKKAVGRAISI